MELPQIINEDFEVKYLLLNRSTHPLEIIRELNTLEDALEELKYWGRGYVITPAIFLKIKDDYFTKRRK